MHDLRSRPSRNRRSRGQVCIRRRAGPYIAARRRDPVTRLSRRTSDAPEHALSVPDILQNTTSAPLQTPRHRITTHRVSSSQISTCRTPRANARGTAPSLVRTSSLRCASRCIHRAQDAAPAARGALDRAAPEPTRTDRLDSRLSSADGERGWQRRNRYERAQTREERMVVTAAQTI